MPSVSSIACSPRDVSKMKPGRSAYGVACWPDGGVLVDGILIRLAEDRFWYVQADGDFVGWARAHGLGMDVEIVDPHSWVHQIQGPKAFDVLADACDGGMPERFRYFDAREVVMGGQPVLVTRTGWTGELGFEVYTRPGMDCEALWGHVTAAGARHGMLDVGLDGMDIRRIEAAILNNGSDIDHTTSAWAAGFGPFVDLAKSGFFGRDALEAMTDRRTRMYGIACGAAEPLIGGPVARNGKEIGHITAAGVGRPGSERGIGYVRLARAADFEPRSVEVMGFDLATHAATIVDLPFYDRGEEDSARARGGDLAREPCGLTRFIPAVRYAKGGGFQREFSHSRHVVPRCDSGEMSTTRAPNRGFEGIFRLAGIAGGNSRSRLHASLPRGSARGAWRDIRDLVGYDVRHGLHRPGRGGDGGRGLAALRRAGTRSRPGRPRIGCSISTPASSRRRPISRAPSSRSPRSTKRTECPAGRRSPTPSR